MTLGQMIYSKLELGLTCEDIAGGSGVPISTVRKVFSKQTKRPRRQTLEDLSKYFEDRYDPAQIRYYRDEAKLHGDVDYGIGEAMVVRESGAYMKSEARDLKSVNVKSIDDFDEMPIYPRVELIGGEVFTMEAPSVTHQMVVTKLLLLTATYIKKNKGHCTALVSPIAVQPIENDKETVVQPDFLVVCDKKKLEYEKHIIGAPDWVVEVLSPSTRSKDMTAKRDIYKKAGVREYWMVDLEGEYVILYEYAKTDIPSIKLMKDPIPVGIYDGKLEIDLSELVDSGDK